MKRHPSLAPLSREHHPALLLAQLLKKDAPPYREMPSTPESKAVYAYELFVASLQQHFRKEEQMLEKVKKWNERLGELAAEIAQEHRELEVAFNTIRSSGDLATDLDKLGKKLELHIRKEERVLFPLIEEHCPEDTLAGISTLLQENEGHEKRH